MKPFRAVIVNSVVLSAVNTGEVRPNDFVVAVTGTALTQAGRRRFVEFVRAPTVPGNDPSGVPRRTRLGLIEAVQRSKGFSARRNGPQEQAPPKTEASSRPSEWRSGRRGLRRAIR